MPEFMPFSGIRFDEAVAGPLKSVVAPPYDVINESEVATLQAQSQFNVTHLTRPTGDQPYAAAAQKFADWKSAGVLKADDAPVFYIYRQMFADPDTGERFPERVGIIGLLRLEDFTSGAVLPHENTLAAARADRLALIRETLANFEPIYGLFADPTGIVAKAISGASSLPEFLGEVDDMIGSNHYLEALSDPFAVETITRHLSNVPIFIADGHHRYETSLGFSKERPDLPGAGYILIALTALEDCGLLVLPTHRVLNGFEPGEIELLPARLIEKGFSVVPNQHSNPSLLSLQFLLVLPGAEYLIALDESVDIESVVPGDQSAAWKSLDVSVLHTLIIGDVLEVPLEMLSTTDKIAYTRDSAEARRMVKAGQAQAAIIMGRPTVNQMKAVSEAGDKMPQKSTFFFPKLLSGLVLYDFKG